MSRRFDFERLVEICRLTHEETRRSAVQAADHALVVRNWLFGWYIVEYEQQGADRAEYGTQTLKNLSEALRSRIGRGFSVDALERMRRFYLLHEQILAEVPKETKSATLSRISGAQPISETPSRISPDPSLGREPVERIPQTLSAELARHFALGWSHYVTLLSIDDADARRFYEIEAADGDWSVRELKRKSTAPCTSGWRSAATSGKCVGSPTRGQVVEKAADLIKDPVVLEFLGLEERPTYSESELETAIIDRFQQFLLELGKGFLFEARQKRFSFGNRHFFVDLVFYNRLLRCYVLIDLKRGELTHQDLGQMQMYVNYFDRHVKTGDEFPTVGILLCDRKNDAVVELTLPEDANVYASKYQLYLPSKQELAAQLADVRREIEQREVGGDA